MRKASFIRFDTGLEFDCQQIALATADFYIQNSSGTLYLKVFFSPLI
jgi:hypothetical protein